MKAALQAGQWYRDSETEQRFKVLKVEEYTLEVVDEHGFRRTVNRMMCEMAFVLEQETV